jgi:uncharacterized membrane protein YhaH (DUF805 family)
MTFQDAVMQALSRYADFTGRARRREYWFFVLFAILSQFIASGLDLAVSALLGFGLFQILVGLALLVPGIAAGVRRLHDRNMSGWWLLAPSGASLVLTLLSLLGGGGILGGLLAAVALGAGFLLVVILALPGTPGPNRFGPDPKEA